jgi:hypothetical protein
MNATVLIDEYDAFGLPLGVRASGMYAAAILVTLRHIQEPRFEPEPSPTELRLLVEHCAYFIHAPAWKFPARELKMLRASIEHIKTVPDLANWLWGCRQIGIRPL